MKNCFSNNKRIAKNTLFLYLRTLIILVVSLYTSRIVLNALGVEDYGIYNVVGGVVAMFNVISGALSSAISRFITFELGKGISEKLKTVFSTSVNIQVFFAIIILIIGEIVGVWFLNYKMNIPTERMVAANWVLQLSLLTFCVNLTNIPYNACIIAHEKMDVFAYVSIFEAVLKLLICYLIIVSPWDKLIFYASLQVCVVAIIRITYTVYCRKYFEESHYHFVFDKQTMKEMTGFVGWNLFTNSAYVFNTQGVNILINIFFGVTINAARGIATQVESAIMQLVNSFTTALNPQITKNYAAGNNDEMVSLVCRGAKFSYYLLFLFALPVIVETDSILKIWLKLVPPHAVNFVRLAIIAALMNIIGKTGFTACMATGNIRRYVLWVTSIGFLAFPLTWVAFALGAPSEATYIVFIIVYAAVEAVRLWIMKDLLHFPVGLFVREVVVKIVFVTVLSAIIPVIFTSLIEPSLIRVICTIIISVISAALTIYLFGLTTNERQLIVGMILNKIHSKKTK